MLTQTSLYFDLSRILLSFILLLSIYIKSVKPLFDINTNSALINISLKSFEKNHIYLIFFISFLLIGTPWSSAPLVGSMLLAVVGGSGYILRKFSIIGECNCYGDINEKGFFNKKTLNSIVFICLFYNFSFYAFSRQGTSNVDNPEMLVVIFFAINLTAALSANSGKILEAINSFKEKSNLGHQNADYGIQDKNSYDPNLIIGENSTGEIIRISDIRHKNGLVLFIMLSEQCAACVNSKAMLYRLTASFSDKITTIIVHKQKNIDPVEHQKIMNLSGSDDFFKVAKNELFPASFILNTNDLSQVGELVYTPASIWQMYYRLLSVAILKA